MKIALFSDIHANLEALEAVLADAEAEECDSYICLGDIVGYNADPSACLERVRALDCPVIKGNHDQDGSSDASLDMMNANAAAGGLGIARHVLTADIGMPEIVADDVCLRAAAGTNNPGHNWVRYVCQHLGVH